MQPSHDRAKSSSQGGPVIYIPLGSLHSQPCTLGAQCMSGRWTQIKMPSLHQASGVWVGLWSKAVTTQGRLGQVVGKLWPL